MTKAISLLGSTGSIGRQTLEVCAELGIRVEALTAHHNIDLLEQQTRQFQPRLVVLYEEAAARELANRLSDMAVRVVWGPEGLIEAAALPESDTVVTAVVGMVGLRPTLAPLRRASALPLPTRRHSSAPVSW